MGVGYIHKCDKCDYSVHTSGPWEFYRDDKGERKSYGHPVPISEEAAVRGIHGLSGDLYCSNCDKVFDIVLVEFEKPVKDSFLVWNGKYNKKESTMKCPECNNTNLIFGCEKEIICPRCKKGKLICKIAWIL